MDIKDYNKIKNYYHNLFLDYFNQIDNVNPRVIIII